MTQQESPHDTPANKSLDPNDWTDLRSLGHRMVDDMFDHLSTLRDRPVWQPMPVALRRELRQPLPRDPSPAEAVYDNFQRLVQPYATGNLHPRFMGWVHGGGNAVGMLAELLAGGLNANLGGRDHAPLEVERQVIAWAAEMLGFPPDASGVLVTGTSIANLISILVARSAKVGPSVRTGGVDGTRLVAYTSAAAHGCLPRAMEMVGLGRNALRMIPCNDLGRMRLDALAQSIAVDRANGDRPFLVIGTAGTVDIGAIDELEAIADLAAGQGLWFHIDAAFGAIAALAPRLRPLLAGIERAELCRLRFSQMGAGALRRGLCRRPRPIASPGCVRCRGGLPPTRGTWSGGRRGLAQRLGPRPLPRLPRLESVDDLVGCMEPTGSVPSPSRPATWRLYWRAGWIGRQRCVVWRRSR